MISQENWVWYGSPQHFCCASMCRFHLATKVGEYIISTVGNYHSLLKLEDKLRDINEDGAEEVGCGRFYETMVFLCGEEDKECGCHVNITDLSEVDFKGYQTASEANAGHFRMCEKYAEEQ